MPTGHKARRSGPSPTRRRGSANPYIDEPRAQADGRVVPGHCEVGPVIAENGTTAVATLVGRTSRFFILVPSTGQDSLIVGDASSPPPTGLPAQVRRSLTWDCGSEMARHATITATALPVFFAHTHSRGDAQQREPQPHRPRIRSGRSGAHF